MTNKRLFFKIVVAAYSVGAYYVLAYSV